jgi:hypothetical protein
MAKLYGKHYTREELLTRVGNISQIAGIKKVRYSDGNEDGVEAYIFRTGSGLSFTVLASRGMDVSQADWCGRPLGFVTAVGEASPVYYDDKGMGWLRNFGGGLFVTCGLTYLGAPDVDQGEELGLHGRASNIPARNVSYDAEWQGDEYLMWAKGRLRETRMYGENLVLTRKISARLGEDKIWVDDTVENQGFETTPHMILYHCNAGFPALDEGSELVSPTLSAVPRDSGSEIGKERYAQFEKPTPGWTERVYYHDMAPNSDGTVTAAIVNRNIPGGFGFYVKYFKDELPWLTEWKMNGLGTYVVGIEPGNCHVGGRSKERAEGTLQFLEPGEVRKYRLEIGVLAGEQAISEIDARVRR